MFSSKNTGIREYIKEDGKYDRKKRTKKIKFAFAIYAVKTEVIVGCFVAFILSFSLLPFTRPHSFLSLSASVTDVRALLFYLKSFLKNMCSYNKKGKYILTNTG